MSYLHVIAEADLLIPTVSVPFRKATRTSLVALIPRHDRPPSLAVANLLIPAASVTFGRPHGGLVALIPLHEAPSSLAKRCPSPLPAVVSSHCFTGLVPRHLDSSL